MASLKNVCRRILPVKRPVDDADDCELEEYRKPKTVMARNPPAKMRTVQVVRDFPPGCGIKEESVLMKVERNPLKNVSNFDSFSFQNVKLESFESKEDCFKIKSERNPLKNLDNKLCFENDKLKTLKPKGLGRTNNPTFASRPTGKVKFCEPIVAQRPKVTTRVTTRVTRVVARPSENKKLIKRKELAKERDDAQKAKVTKETHKLTSFKTKEVRRNNNPTFGSRSTGKVKFYDPTTEGDDGKSPKVTTTVTTVVTVVPRPSDSKPKELGRNDPSFGSRPIGKVPNCCPSQKSKDDSIVLSSKEQVRREKIKEAMIMFDGFNSELYELNRSKPKEEKIAHWRVSVEAAKKVQQKLKWMDAKKTLGSICGVRVGDRFKYRSQLKMIGLHCQPQSGIDYTMIEGRNLAISIVDAHRYSNQRQSCDELCYSGHGGIPFLGNKQVPPEDQKLERGNLALKNSMIEKTPVRVIRKLQGAGSEEVFAYDGLYAVEDYTQKKGEHGKTVFKLKRRPGQPPLHLMLNGGSSGGGGGSSWFCK